MISGISKTDKSLKTLLYFGDDPLLFEKEIITEFDDGIISGKTYNFSKQEVQVKVEEHIDEDVTDTRIETISYSKNDLIEYAIDIATYRAIEFLQKNYYQVDDYGKHQWIFARIQKCYLSAFEVTNDDYPYRDHFIKSFTEIVRKSHLLYSKIFVNQFNLTDVEKKLNSFPKPNMTGFKLKLDIYYTKTKPFTERLIDHGFIDSKDCEKFKQFLQGEIPAGIIDWKKTLGYLVYFINKLIEENDKGPVYVLSIPGQQWKYLKRIFSYKLKDLPENFPENYSKLGKKQQKEIDFIFESLKI